MMIRDRKMIRKKNVIKKMKVIRKKKVIRKMTPQRTAATSWDQMTTIQRSLMMEELILVEVKEYKEVKEKCREKRGYKSKGRFKDKTTTEREHMFAGSELYVLRGTWVVRAMDVLEPYYAQKTRIQPDVTGQVAYDYMIHKYKKLAKGVFLTRCRPLIGLDGCFLKGYYGGQLLSAVSQDGNNSFYVIVYGIVNVENKENWIWFLENLVNDLEDLVEKGLTFISDRQKLNKDAAKWLNDIPADRWSRSAFDTVCKNQAVTFNMCEQFNGAILKYRGKPIITMLEGETNDNIYSNYINPAVGEGFWETTGFDPIQSPIVKRKSGKPKTKRKKAPEEDFNPHKMKRKLGPPRCSRCKQVGHKKTSCKANLGDGDTTAATNETRPSDVPVDGANEKTRASQVSGEGGSAAAGDNANDAPAAQDGHFGPIPSQPELQSAQPLQTDHHTTTHVTPPSGIAVRPPPMRPSMMPHPRAPITKETIEGTSAGTAQRFAAFMNTGAPRPPQ
ncbi:hypothetical protein CRG98_017318 [Punica granatum]|uniref:MULE transposase domain-containing protein n=1 Tax=Punica granatum TaxID=22663 RepID=A0A2I0K175_PUNGR|nr:hypothetical protein CRG98_017318 [Punica granatum]